MQPNLTQFRTRATVIVYDIGGLRQRLPPWFAEPQRINDVRIHVADPVVVFIEWYLHNYEHYCVDGFSPLQLTAAIINFFEQQEAAIQHLWRTLRVMPLPDSPAVGVRVSQDAVWIAYLDLYVK